jgi:hypothetical protein
MLKYTEDIYIYIFLYQPEKKKKKKKKHLIYYRVISLVPISNEKSVIPSRFREWDGNSRPAEDFNTSKATSCLVELKRWEIEKTAYLIFHLQCVGEVFAWRDGACGSIHSILVRISPLLNPIPVTFFQFSSTPN